MTQRGPVVRKEDRESTLDTRGFSGARRSREKKRVGHYKDLTEIGNRARKVSGTKGAENHKRSEMKQPQR